MIAEDQHLLLLQIIKVSCSEVIKIRKGHLLLSRFVGVDGFKQTQTTWLRDPGYPMALAMCAEDNDLLNDVQ
jgi:hypothetical protein